MLEQQPKNVNTGQSEPDDTPIPFRLGPAFDLEARLALAVEQAVRRVLVESHLAETVDDVAGHLVASLPDHAVEHHALWSPVIDDEEDGPHALISDIVARVELDAVDLRAAAASGVEWGFRTIIEDGVARAVYNAIRERIANT